MGKRHNNDYTHLTFDERRTIQIGIENRAIKVSIANTVGKDATTVAKEISKHRIIKPRNAYGRKNLCVHKNECGPCSKTIKQCDRYQEPTCKERDRSPGACNGCLKFSACKLDRYVYDAKLANDMYKENLIKTRSGLNIDKSTLEAIAKILVPLINQGQSIYQILLAHPEISQCSKTIYTYIDQGVFKEYGLDSFSLKEKVQRKQLKKRFKKRNEAIIYEGRRYSDYLRFIENNPDIPTVQMDTVYNSPDGPYIQTLLFKRYNFMIGFVHKEKTAASMSETFNYLERKLGKDNFIDLFPLILTDRGTEFGKPELFEYSGVDGEFRLNLFYCDPMQATQKAHIENNHNFIRDIITNELRLSDLSNVDLSLMFSHINSVPRKKLNGRTPYQLFELIYSSEILDLLDIKKLRHDEVILKPYLLEYLRKLWVVPPL